MSAPEQAEAIRALPFDTDAKDVEILKDFFEEQATRNWRLVIQTASGLRAAFKSRASDVRKWLVKECKSSDQRKHFVQVTNEWLTTNQQNVAANRAEKSAVEKELGYFETVRSRHALLPNFAHMHRHAPLQQHRLTCVAALFYQTGINDLRGCLLLSNRF